MNKTLTPAQIKEFYSISKPAMPVPVHRWKMGESFQYDTVNGSLPKSAYTSSGTDVNLSSPDDSYHQDSCFVPMNTDVSGSGPDGLIYVGSYGWNLMGGLGPDSSVYSEGVGSSYGNVYLTTGVALYWETFAGSEFNGIQRIWLPGSAYNDRLGGYIEFYYHRDAFYSAFYGNGSSCSIAQNGSVYRGTVSDENLVVRWDGQLGPAVNGGLDVGSSPAQAACVDVIQYQDGFRGKSYGFDGSASEVELTPSSIPTGKYMTISFYAYIDSDITSSSTNIVMRSEDSGSNDSILISLPQQSDLTVYYACGNVTSSKDQISKLFTGNAAYNSWSHWAFTKNVDDGTLKIYLNGELWHSGTALTREITASNGASIGRSPAGGNTAFKGRIRDFRIYDAELNAREIKDIFRGLE